MTTIIKDGQGSGISAGVDSRGRLLSAATTQAGDVAAKKRGDAYVLSSGLVNLTTDGESGILYFKTLEDSDISIDTIQLQFGQSTGGSGDVIRTDYVVVTGGTLLSNAVPAISVNLNVGSAKTVDATQYRGVEGDTISGIPAGASIYQAGTNYEESIGGFVVPKGSDIALSITPPTGNTSMNVVINVFFHLLDSE